MKIYSLFFDTYRDGNYIYIGTATDISDASNICIIWLERKINEANNGEIAELEYTMDIELFTKMCRYEQDSIRNQTDKFTDVCANLDACQSATFGRFKIRCHNA